ncbi:hypothetical protein SSX86_018269 [Deinandra increscens subsp. villosa]|uniref:DCD domain-containing protein n=1 Tax=Deinandra increscens subsp. villosa TaxID=3103831 RepID=A0AAP0CXJ1_9ASTR
MPFHFHYLVHQMRVLKHTPHIILAYCFSGRTEFRRFVERPLTYSSAVEAIKNGRSKAEEKKINLNWATKEAPVLCNYSAPARNLRKSDLHGVICGTTHNTINECLSKQLFGLPEGHFSYIKNIKPGLPLFLFNYSDRVLHGIFEAAGPGQMNIDSYAWVAEGDDTGYTRFPAQVKICVQRLCNPLSEEQFQPVIIHNYHDEKHFYFELDYDQTKQLVSLFTSSPMNSGVSTKWSNLYASLPANPKGREYKAPISPRIADLRQKLPEDSNQTSKLSYANALGRTNTATTTGSSSQHAGKWSELFKSETGYGKESQSVGASKNEFTGDQTSKAVLSPHANTSWDEFSFKQEHEEKSDFIQAGTWEDGWEDSQWDQTWVSDPEANMASCSFNDQTWVSDPQANMAADKPYVMQENTWDESQHVTANICEAGPGQTSHSSGQHLGEPSSSSQRLDDNLGSGPSLSVETTESENEEKHEQRQLCSIRHGMKVADTVVETSTNLQPSMVELMQELEAMKGSQLKQIVKINRLEQELDAWKHEVQLLRNRVDMLESGSQSILDPAEVHNQLPSNFVAKFTESVFIVGGHDGFSWLPALDSYIPSNDIKISLPPMTSIKKYASAATLNGELYHFGGDGPVESFNTANNQWIQRPPLYWKNTNVSGASVMDKLFVVGGGDRYHFSSEVEYLDMNIGKWFPVHSMHSKRLAPAAAELNNVLYVTGGFDGESYLSSVERFDPREKLWYKIPSMNARKGCHSMVVLNEKLYTVGGVNGDEFLATLEYLDMRMGAWVEAESMNITRANLGAFVLGEKIYAIGGWKENNEVLDIVECYKEGSGWEIAANLKAIGKRSHFSALVL